MMESRKQQNARKLESNTRGGKGQVKKSLSRRKKRDRRCKQKNEWLGTFVHCQPKQLTKLNGKSNSLAPLKYSMYWPPLEASKVVALTKANQECIHQIIKADSVKG
eukprot:15013737-Ditylum_brightwellii.AAC.1